MRLWQVFLAVVCWGRLWAAGPEWVRPESGTDEPLWGLRGGLMWSLPPAGFRGGEPRGLVRIGYPVEPGGKPDLVNFVAIEPVVAGRRGFSELERSGLDGKAGKRLWVEPHQMSGAVRHEGSGVEVLEVEVKVEPFENQARPRLVVRQRSDRPDEMEFEVQEEPGGKPMAQCVLTATMGNLGRVRRLWLREKVLESGAVFGGYRGDGFTEHWVAGLKDLARWEGGDVCVAVTTDEERPEDVYPFPGTLHWHYGGRRVTQYWRKPAAQVGDELEVAVNGRFTYWMSRQPIPGGVAFENFELREPYRAGQRSAFGVTFRTPEEMGLKKAAAIVAGAGPPAAAAIPATPSLALTNSSLILGFDGETGAWTSLVDRNTGVELLAPGELAGPAPVKRPVLDMAAVTSACRDGHALDLAGNGWQYAVVRDGATNGGARLQWETTAVPGRRGEGDDRLAGKVGEFLYRREFVVTSGWSSNDLVLVLGAVDDFDRTELNGVEIGRTGEGTVQHWESPRWYRVPAGLLRGNGATNVLVVRVANGASEGGIAAPVVLGLRSALPQPLQALPLLTGVQTDNFEGSWLLRLKSEDGPWQYTLDLRLPASGAWLSRQLTVMNASESGQLLQTATLGTPVIATGEGGVVLFPGSLPVGGVALAGLADGELLRPRSEEPLAVVWNPERKMGVGCWYHCEEEFAPVTVVRREWGVQVRHSQQVIMRLEPRESVSLGRQYLWVGRGRLDALLQGVKEPYARAKLSAPTNGLPGLGGMVVYCGHPGGVPERGFQGYGGFKAMQAYLPVLERMKVDLLWLLPVWEHGDGRQWNLYAPFDHFKVSPLYGTAGELKELSAAARERRMGLMFDLVPHGPPEDTELAKAHPEWVARDAEGNPQRAWGQLAFDNRHPGWQAHMRRAATWGAQEFGAVGARVDCAAGGPLNWDKSLGNRPSLSGLAAGLGMTRAVREGYVEAGQAPVVLPEEYTGLSVYHRVSDLTYDAQFYFLQMELQAGKASPELWARQLQRFLHDQQLVMPPGALKMRWIANHDTVNWTFQKARPVRVYGPGRMRALLALCAFAEGVPMLYQGDEDPRIWGGDGESNVEYLSRVYGLRKELEGLREGRADYGGVQASGGVWAVKRGEGRDRVLVLISFNPEPVQSRLQGSAYLGGNWLDRMNGERLELRGARGVSMSPHQVRVLTPINRE